MAWHYNIHQWSRLNRDAIWGSSQHVLHNRRYFMTFVEFLFAECDWTLRTLREAFALHWRLIHSAYWYRAVFGYNWRGHGIHEIYSADWYIEQCNSICRICQWISFPREIKLCCFVASKIQLRICCKGFISKLFFPYTPLPPKSR